MAVTIIRDSDIKFIKRIEQMIEGKAYMDADGDIFICNRVDDVIAFSVCGTYVIGSIESDEDLANRKLREVNLTITVE